MAYNYLSLANDVNKRLNEVELTDATFAGTRGQHSLVKDAINYALRDINQDAYTWPFNYREQEVILVPGQTRYAFPANYKTAENVNFRIARDDALGTETILLSILAYEDYLANYVDQEYNTADEGIRSVPEFVFKSKDLEFGVVPAPDEEYRLIYEYYAVPDDLVAATDVPTLPENFRKTIVNGAMYYVYMFRSDVENTQLAEQKYNDDLKQVRGLYINRFEYAKSTMIERNSRSTLVNERLR